MGLRAGLRRWNADLHAPQLHQHKDRMSQGRDLAGPRNSPHWQRWDKWTRHLPALHTEGRHTYVAIRQRQHAHPAPHRPSQHRQRQRQRRCRGRCERFVCHCIVSSTAVAASSTAVAAQLREPQHPPQSRHSSSARPFFCYRTLRSHNSLGLLF